MDSCVHIVRIQTDVEGRVKTNDNCSSPVSVGEIYIHPQNQRKILSGEHILVDDLEQICLPMNLESNSKNSALFHTPAGTRSPIDSQISVYEEGSEPMIRFDTEPPPPPPPPPPLPLLETPISPLKRIKGLGSSRSNMKRNRRLFLSRLKSLVPRRSHLSLVDEDLGPESSSDPVSVTDSNLMEQKISIDEIQQQETQETEIQQQEKQETRTTEKCQDRVDKREHGKDEVLDNYVFQFINDTMPPAVSRPSTPSIPSLPSYIKQSRGNCDASTDTMSSVSLSEFQCDLDCRNSKVGVKYRHRNNDIDNSFSSSSATADNSSNAWSARDFVLTLLDSTLDVLSDGTPLCSSSSNCFGRER